MYVLYIEKIYNKKFKKNKKYLIKMNIIINIKDNIIF